MPDFEPNLCLMRLVFFTLVFLLRALTKETDIGISAQRIEDDIVEEILVQGGAVSPIVTLEPRRRKFHKAITVNMPLPERSLRTLRNGLEDTSTSAGSSRKTSSESLNKLKGNFRSGQCSILIRRLEGTGTRGLQCCWSQVCPLPMYDCLVHKR